MAQCSAENNQSVQVGHQPAARLSGLPVHNSSHLIEEAL